MIKSLRFILFILLAITFFSCGDSCKPNPNPNINRELGWYPLQKGNYWLSYVSGDFSDVPFKNEILHDTSIHVEDISETLTVAFFSEGPAEAYLGGYKVYRLGISEDGRRLYSVTMDLAYNYHHRKKML